MFYAFPKWIVYKKIELMYDNSSVSVQCNKIDLL